MIYLLIRYVVFRKQHCLVAIEGPYRDWSMQRPLASCRFANRIRSKLSFDWSIQTEKGGFALQPSYRSTNMEAWKRASHDLRVCSYPLDLWRGYICIGEKRDEDEGKGEVVGSRK